MEACASHLEQNSLWSMMTDKPDPFLVITRMRDDNTRFPVYQSEPHKKTLHPIWRPFEVSVDRLCAGNYDCPLLLEIYDAHLTQSPELLGTAQTTLRLLMNSPTQHITLIDQVTKKKKGVLELTNIREKEVDNPNAQRRIATRGRYPPLYTTFSFLDFLSGGLELSMTFAIDYTVSNGLPTSEKSLHHFSNYGPNDYEKAIMAVGSIVANYSTDQFFPVFGFGGNPPGSDSVSHCFPVNGNAARPEVQGLGGVLDAYRRSLSSVKLSAPTTFSQVIKAAAEHAVRSSANQAQKYSVLLILTDGVITTGNNTTYLDDTISEIVNASSTPLSIIVVGIGAEDFANMAVLDASDEPLHSHHGKVAARDIVMFVPFRNYANSDPAKLAADVLAELPDQVLAYMAMTKQKPKPRVRVQQGPPPPGVQPKQAPMPNNPQMRPSPSQGSLPAQQQQQPMGSPQPPFFYPTNGQMPPPGMMMQPGGMQTPPPGMMMAPPGMMMMQGGVPPPQQNALPGGKQPPLQRQPTGQVPEGFLQQQQQQLPPGWGMILVQTPNGPGYMPVPPGTNVNQMFPGMQWPPGMPMPPPGMQPPPGGMPMPPQGMQQGGQGGMPMPPPGMQPAPGGMPMPPQGMQQGGGMPMPPPGMQPPPGMPMPTQGMQQGGGVAQNMPQPPQGAPMTRVSSSGQVLPSAPPSDPVLQMQSPQQQQFAPQMQFSPQMQQMQFPPPQMQMQPTMMPAPGMPLMQMTSGTQTPPQQQQSPQQQQQQYSRPQGGPQAQAHPESPPSAPSPPSLAMMNQPQQPPIIRPVNPFDASPSAPPMVPPPVDSKNPFDHPPPTSDRFNPFATVNVRHNIQAPDRPTPVIHPAASVVTAPPYVPATTPASSSASHQPPPQPQPSADELRFASELQQLQSMGFSDTPKNIRLLKSKNGNVQQAIEELLQG